MESTVPLDSETDCDQRADNSAAAAGAAPPPAHVTAAEVADDGVSWTV